MWQSVAITGGCILFVVIIASLLSIRRVVVLETAQCFEGERARKRIHRYFLPRCAQALRRSHACPGIARCRLRSPARGTNLHCCPSGCGKTTLLSVITGCWIQATEKWNCSGAALAVCQPTSGSCFAVKTSASFSSNSTCAGADGRRKRGGPPDCSRNETQGSR